MGGIPFGSREVLNWDVVLIIRVERRVDKRVSANAFRVADMIGGIWLPTLELRRGISGGSVRDVCNEQLIANVWLNRIGDAWKWMWHERIRGCVE